MIYRSATEVHWDNNENFLYSPKPRDWTYLDWYKQIVSSILAEYKCKLTITADKKWVAISDVLRNNIIDLERQ